MAAVLLKLLFSAFLFMAVIGCSKDRTVKYAVSCTSCTVWYLDEEELTQETTVSGQWSTHFEGIRNRSLWLYAENTEAGGPLSLRISCAGRLLDTASAAGDTTLTADGKVPY